MLTILRICVKYDNYVKNRESAAAPVLKNALNNAIFQMRGKWPWVELRRFRSPIVDQRQTT